MKKWLAIILFFSLAYSSFAAVGFDKATADVNGNCNAATSWTWVHEGGGSSVTAIVVGSGGTSMNTAVFNGETLNLINNLNDTVLQYGLSASSSVGLIASGTITVTTPNDSLSVGSISFTDTATGTAVTSWIGATSSLANLDTTSYSLGLTTTRDGSMNVDHAFVAGNGTSFTVSGTDQTLRWSDDECAANPESYGSTQPITSSSTLATMSGSWTGSLNRRALMAEVLAGAVAAPAAVNNYPQIIFLNFFE